MQNEEQKNILEAINNQINALFRSVKGVEDFLYKQEQISEAQADERVLEGPREIRDAIPLDEEDDKGAREAKKQGGIFDSIMKALFRNIFTTVLAFAPIIMKFFTDNKEMLKSLPGKIKLFFVKAFDTLSLALKEYIIDPFSKFFTVYLPAAWDVLVNNLRDMLDNIFDVPTLLFNSFQLYANEVWYDIVESFTNLVEKIGFTSYAQKTLRPTLQSISKKRQQIQDTETAKLTERAARQSKGTISEQFSKAVSVRQVEQKKDNVPVKDKVPAQAPVIKVTGREQQFVVDALTNAGITDPKAISNILAQVKAESNFVPRSENMNYSAEGLRKTFPKYFSNDQIAEQYARNPEKIGSYVYADRMGNGSESSGDGWKYRGRGFIQLTGKDAYIAAGKYIGEDLVNNPDLLNNPEIAAKIIPWFFLEYKNYLIKDVSQLSDISTVNKAVGFAGGREEAAEREILANQFSAAMVPAEPVRSIEPVQQQADASTSADNTGKVVVNNVSPVNIPTHTPERKTTSGIERQVALSSHLAATSGVS